MINSKTKLGTLSPRKIKALTILCLEYCENVLGVNKRKRTQVEINVSKGCEDNKTLAGWYDPIENEISIMLDSCKTVGNFTATFVHEYTHYLQPCRTKYHKLLEEHGYTNHPFELEAYGNEIKHNRKLLNIVRKKIK